MTTTPSDKQLFAGKSLKINPESKKWLKLALDPYHDYESEVSGLPDSDTERSCIQIIKKQYTIRAPPGQEAGTWSAQVSVLPLLTTHGANSECGTEPHACYPGKYAEASVETFGTVTAISLNDETDQDFWPTADSSRYTASSSTRNMRGFSPTDGSNDESMMKIIGGGFEVHNSTAELYKSGSVTVSCSPQGGSHLALCQVGNGVGEAEFKLTENKVFRAPPRTQSQAVLNGNARTWEAAEGCMVPFRLDLNSGTQYKPAQHGIVSFFDNDRLLDDIASSSEGPIHDLASGGICYSKASSLLITPNIGGVNTNLIVDGSYHRTAALETSTATFTGLSFETVLTLDMKFIVEVAPTVSNPTLMSMSTQAAPYDPKALEAYSRMITHLPPGVKVSMNAAGDWWRMVLRTGGMVASSLAPLIPNPAAKMIVTGAGQLLSSVPAHNNKAPVPKPRSKTKQTVINARTAGK